MITGASSGIGLAGAKRIAAEGGEVMITGRNLHKLEQLRTQLPHHTTLLQNDGAEPESAQALADAVESFGMLDGLWLNAGQLAFSSVENCSATQFDTIMANNVRAAVFQVASLSRFFERRGIHCTDRLHGSL